MDEPAPPKNILRRTIGVALCSLPLWLAVACAVWRRPVPGPIVRVAMVLVVLSGLVGCLNMHLLFVKPWLYRRRHGGSLEGFRFVSGLPVVGTLLQAGACFMAFGSVPVGVCALLTALIDTCGVPWIPVLTWKDSSFWDA